MSCAQFDYLEGLNFDDRRVLLDEKMGRVTPVIQDHVGLPVFTPGNTFINAPPVDKKKKYSLNSVLQINSLCSAFKCGKKSRANRI